MKRMAEDQNQVAGREQMADQVAGEEQTNQLAEIQNEEMAEDHNELIAEEEQDNLLAGEEEANQLAEHQEEEKESEMHVEDGRDQADTVSIPSEAVMDPSPVAFQFGDASDDYAPHSVEGAENTNCGWLMEEDEEDDDDEIIHLTPEPLCKELEELLREIRGQKKRKIGSRCHELLCGVMSSCK